MLSVLRWTGEIRKNNPPKQSSPYLIVPVFHRDPINYTGEFLVYVFIISSQRRLKQRLKWTTNYVRMFFFFHNTAAKNESEVTFHSHMCSCSALFFQFEHNVLGGSRQQHLWNSAPATPGVPGEVLSTQGKARGVRSEWRSRCRRGNRQVYKMYPISPIYLINPISCTINLIYSRDPADSQNYVSWR